MFKLIAVASMLIDHVGMIFFPHLVILRAIGRLAFPMFAYGIAIGVDKTRNLKHYLQRMVLWAALSQIPYMFFLDENLNKRGLNVMVTFALSIGLLYIYKQYGKMWFGVGVLPTLLFAEWSKSDYGAYGVMTVLVFYFLKQRMTARNLAFTGVTIIFVIYQLIQTENTVVGVYFLAILSVLFFDVFNDNENRIRLPRYFFYAFYPIHILLLRVIFEVLKKW